MVTVDVEMLPYDLLGLNVTQAQRRKDYLFQEPIHD